MDDNEFEWIVFRMKLDGLDRTMKRWTPVLYVVWGLSLVLFVTFLVVLALR